MNVLHFTNHLTGCFKNLKMFLPLIEQFHIQEMILRKTQNKIATTKISLYQYTYEDSAVVPHCPDNKAQAPQKGWKGLYNASPEPW